MLNLTPTPKLGEITGILKPAILLTGLSVSCAFTGLVAGLAAYQYYICFIMYFQNRMEK
jgi:hypothetical protein